MFYSNYIAELLVDSECYVHAPVEKLINVPTGDQILAYLSCRLLISKVREREIIEKALTELVSKNFSCNVTIAGLATAGITWGHAIASTLKLPMLYIRSSDKGYGLGGLIEGDLKNSFSEVILVDDILYTGSSALVAQEELVKNNIRVVGIVCIATLNDVIAKQFESQGMKVLELTTYNDILALAEKKSVLNGDEVKLMKRFYERR